MRLYRVGDSGSSIRDIQDRLEALGFPCEPDPKGEFAGGTRTAVVGFQRSRGVDPDGIVGPDTWRALYEAGYHLGDRLLFLRRPMLRGDDVGELQRRLNALGFDAGKVDGIFGPDTERALLDFQRNRRMAEDAACGPVVVAELHLMARATQKTGREAVREREWLRRLPRSVVGSRVYLDPGCRDPAESDAAWAAATASALALQQRGGIPLLSRSADVHLPDRVRARRANRLGADLIVGYQFPGSDRTAVYFFASPLSRSEAGALLAHEVASLLGLEVEGRATPILKETRAPAIVVASAALDRRLGAQVADGVLAFFRHASLHEVGEAAGR